MRLLMIYVFGAIGLGILLMMDRNSSGNTCITTDLTLLDEDKGRYVFLDRNIFRKRTQSFSTFKEIHQCKEYGYQFEQRKGYLHSDENFEENVNSSERFKISTIFREEVKSFASGYTNYYLLLEDESGDLWTIEFSQFKKYKLCPSEDQNDINPGVIFFEDDGQPFFLEDYIKLANLYEYCGNSNMEL